MMLYCLGQNLFIKELKERYPRLIAYADDILIFHSDATRMAKQYGLTINMDKCRSTQRGQEVTFLGAPVSRQRLSIATKAIAKATENLKLVMESPISHHAKLTLARICVVPMANCAPLVEMDSPPDEYESFDKRVGEALAGMLGSQKQLRDTFKTLDMAAGLARVLPTQLLCEPTGRTIS